MPVYTANVFVNTRVGEVKWKGQAATTVGAKDLIYAQYGDVQRITNLYEARDQSGDGVSVPDVGGSMGVLILAIGAILLFMFTPWILMLGGGASGAWIGEKVTRTSVDEARGNAGAILITLIMLGGGFGFVAGHEFQTYINSDTPTEQSSQQY